MARGRRHHCLLPPGGSTWKPTGRPWHSAWSSSAVFRPDDRSTAPPGYLRAQQPQPERTLRPTGPPLWALCDCDIRRCRGPLTLRPKRGAGRGLRVASSVPGSDVRHARAHPCVHTHIHVQAYRSPCWLSRASAGQPLGWRASGRACVHCPAPVSGVLSTRASRIPKCFHVGLEQEPSASEITHKTETDSDTSRLMVTKGREVGISQECGVNTDTPRA